METNETTQTQTVKARELFPIEKDFVNAGFTISQENGQYEKALGDGTKLQLNLLKGDFAGLGWTSRVPAGNDENTLQGIIDAWTLQGVLNLITTAAITAQRSKAKSYIVEDADANWIAKMSINAPNLYNSEDVMKWLPGQRGETIASLTKEFNELSKKIADAQDPAKKRELKALRIDILKKKQELEFKKASEDNDEDPAGE